MRISKRIADMPRAGIRVIFDMAGRMEDVIHLEIGCPDLETPEVVREAGVRAIRNGATRYTPNAGIHTLRTRVAEYVNRGKQVCVSAENVVITTGGMGALASTFAAVLDQGDEVLVPDPGWPNYAMQVVCNGGVAVPYILRAENGYRVETEAVVSQITERTKAIVVNSPSNPTGAVIEEKAVAEIIEEVNGKGILVVSDEVYEDIVYDCDNPSFLREGAVQNVACIYSFSKTWAMTGWRVGYVVSSEQLAAEIGKLQEVYYACASSIAQHAAEAALKMPEDEVRRMLSAYKRRRDIVAEALEAKGIPFVKPQGAFYCVVDIGASGMSAYDFAVELLKTERVAVAPVEMLGEDAGQMIRICFAVKDDELREGIKRFLDFLA